MRNLPPMTLSVINHLIYSTRIFYAYALTKTSKRLGALQASFSKSPEPQSFFVLCLLTAFCTLVRASLRALRVLHRQLLSLTAHEITFNQMSKSALLKINKWLLIKPLRRLFGTFMNVNILSPCFQKSFVIFDKFSSEILQQLQLQFLLLAGNIR